MRKNSFARLPGLVIHEYRRLKSIVFCFFAATCAVLPNLDNVSVCVTMLVTMKSTRRCNSGQPLRFGLRYEGIDPTVFFSVKHRAYQDLCACAWRSPFTLFNAHEHVAQAVSEVLPSACLNCKLRPQSYLLGFGQFHLSFLVRNAAVHPTAPALAVEAAVSVFWCSFAQ